MATPIDDELSQIGAALASAATGQAVDLTEAERQALCRAALPDLLEAILPHADLRYQSEVALLVEKWSDECCIGLRDGTSLQELAVAIDADKPVDQIRELFHRDERLDSDERQSLIRALNVHDRLHDEERLSASESARAYIESVQVTGFRGIGPTAMLPLDPGPGLTVVHGPNGSGKSSFVEALDVVLSGNTPRFDARRAEWQQAWSNIHSSSSGGVRVTFSLSGGNGQRTVKLSRSWLGNPLRGGTYDADPSDDLRALGWVEASTEFRPILGYAELGPLFDEGDAEWSARRDSSWRSPTRSTPLAQHVRLRAGVRDALIEHLEHALSDQYAEYNPLRETLEAWHDIGRLVLDRSNRDTSDHTKLLRRSIPTTASGTRISTPRYWDWKEMMSPRYSIPARSPLRYIADAYRNEIVSLLRGGEVAFPLLRLFGKHRYDPLYAPRAKVLGAFSPRDWRTPIYLRMLVEAVYDLRLEQFSQQVAKIWSTIRPNSSIKFDRLLLHHDYENRGRELRVSINLATDDADGIERGILSQGEMSTLALSIFLPTMMRPESPFGFAVIDDPTQGMDDNAIRGFAKVLRTAAKELQVIVATHDGRVLDALRSLDIKHTQINVRRSGQSDVECEVVRDEVLQALEDARLEAEESEGEDETARWRNVGFFCRLAIERACIRAVERRMRRQGREQSEIDDRLRRAVYSQRTTTRKLMSLAIWETTTKSKDLADHLWDKPKWGPHIEQAVYYLNGLNHRDSNKTQWAREEYNDDLYRLIAATRDVVKAVEKNCG